jgi:hypothetical protein
LLIVNGTNLTMKPGQEDVKKSIWPKSKLMQNVCRRPSDRLLGILARLFLEPKFPHTNFSISSHLPDGPFTPIRYVSVAGSRRPVPRGSHTEPSRSCLHLQWNLVRPLSLTEELRLCQNIEHYQLSI